MSNEGLHNLSPLLSGQSLLQQFLLSILLHSDLLPDGCHPLAQMLDKYCTFALVSEKQHLDVQTGGTRRLTGL